MHVYADIELKERAMARRHSPWQSRIKQTPGAIGYVEYGYAKITGLPMASLENKTGKFVTATLASEQAALASVILPPNLSCCGRDFADALLADAGDCRAQAASEIGQHNDYILRELLGLNDQEIIEIVTDEALQ